MGKTFEDWYKEAGLEDYINESLENRSWDTHFEIKLILKDAWEAGRMNMTTRDI